MRLIFLLLYGLTYLASLKAQDVISYPKWKIIGGVQGGFMAAHREQMKHLIQGHSIGGFIQIMKPADGSSDWHRFYNYPESGVDLFFIHTGNSRQLGQQLGLAYTLNLPMIRRAKEPRKFLHWLGLGIGAGYSTKIWDLRENHQADVLGSHFNVALVLSWSARLVAISNTDVRAGLRITHFSNGAFQIPNLGTNNIALFVAVGLPSARLTPRITESISNGFRTQFRTTLAFSLGMQEVPPPTFPKEPTFTFSAWEDYRRGEKSSVTAGIDVFYKEALKRLFEQKNNLTPETSDLIQVGALIGYNLHFNRFEFKMQQGFYLIDSWKETGRLYHRFGLRYHASNHFFAQLMLKTHFSKADHGELGLGYCF